MNSSKTSVMCYFCNEFFGNAHLLQGHIKQCASVLQQCSLCRAYVERRNLESHIRQCRSREHIPEQRVQNNSSFVPKFPQNTNNVYTLPVTNHGTLSDGNQTQHQSLNRMARDMTTSNSQPTRDINGYSVFPHHPQNRSIAIRPRSAAYEEETLQIFRKEIENLRQTLEEERNQREQLKNEIHKMKRQYVLSEDRNQILLATISTLRKTIEDESHKYNALHAQVTQEVEAVRTKFQDLSLRTSQLEMIFNSLQKDIEREQIERSHLELIVNNQDAKLRILNKLETELESIRHELSQEQQSRREIISCVQEEVTQNKESLSREISTNKQQLRDIEAAQNEIIDKLQNHSNDISKYQLLHVDSKTMKATVDEDAAKIEVLDKNVKELMDSVAAMQRERYTGHLNQDISMISSENLDSSGHLLWKIGDFEDKLKDSIDNESVLLSPIFYSDRYGYALQAELHLNGLGKWRGRHMTVSVMVIPGQWDSVLAWPAQFTASIGLKDQTPKRSQAMDIVKTIMVGKKDNQDDFTRARNGDTVRSSDRKKSTENLSTMEKEKRALDASLKKQYVFIPHSSLDKFDYIKNNVAFIEIIVIND